MIVNIDCNFTRNDKSMDYLSIRELAAKFAMPERTVYYHVANSSDIRRKKQWRKKLIHVADFAANCGNGLQELQRKDSSTLWISNTDIDFATLQSTLQELQTQNKLKDDENSTLRRQNTDLETTRNKFIQLHTEEKNEKRSIQEKYDVAQEQHHDEIKKYMIKYHVAIWVILVCITIIIILNWGVIRPQ